MREHPPIPVVDLADHIERLKANDGLRFSQEYEVRVSAASATRPSFQIPNASVLLEAPGLEEFVPLVPDKEVF